jgi:hypothetical protein
MARIPNWHRQALARVGRRCGVLAILLSSCLAVHALGQSSSPNPNAAGSGGIAQLDDGTVSGDTYHNPELGFRYQFPHGWVVNDKATQEKAIAARHQFVWGDDTSAKREHKAMRQCTKSLLFVTRYPQEMRSVVFNPQALLIAADPKCAPGVSFPSTVKDREAIQRIANQLWIYFKTPAIMSKNPARVRVFENAGRVMLEISQSFISSTDELGTSTVQDFSSSVLLMQARDYWVMWMFMADGEIELDQLRATKIFFDAAPAGPAKAR